VQPFERYKDDDFIEITVQNGASKFFLPREILENHCGLVKRMFSDAKGKYYGIVYLFCRTIQRTSLRES
jgi:hypothetical protein